MKSARLGSAVIGVLSIAGSALAGAKTTGNVVVDTATKTASGAMGAARSPSDSIQYISCVNKYLRGSYSAATCVARASNDTSLSCYTTDTELLNAIASLDTDAFIRFKADGAGRCTEVHVTTDHGTSRTPREPSRRVDDERRALALNAQSPSAPSPLGPGSLFAREASSAAARSRFL